MSKIVFVVDDLGPKRSQAISIIRRHTGLSIAEILKKTDSSLPVSSPLLFGRDHAAVAKHLTELSQELTTIDASFRIFELSDSENFYSDCEESYFKLDVGVLSNILTEYEKEKKKQPSTAFRRR